MRVFFIAMPYGRIASLKPSCLHVWRKRAHPKRNRQLGSLHHPFTSASQAFRATRHTLRHSAPPLSRAHARHTDFALPPHRSIMEHHSNSVIRTIRLTPEGVVRYFGLTLRFCATTARAAVRRDKAMNKLGISADLLDHNKATAVARAIRELELSAPWALNGSARMLAQGEPVAPPQPLWQHELEHLLVFVRERIEIDARTTRPTRTGYKQVYVWMAPDDLYGAYVEWCHPSDTLRRIKEPLPQRTFLQEVAGLVMRKKVNVPGARGVKRYRCRIIGWDDLPPEIP